MSETLRIQNTVQLARGVTKYEIEETDFTLHIVQLARGVNKYKNKGNTFDRNTKTK